MFRMATAYYTCNLVPVGLISQAGYSPRWLGGRLQAAGAPARRDALSVHPMTCPFVTRSVEAADALLADSPEEDCLVVAGGCDAMRRLGDLLATVYPGRVFTIPMPRSSIDGATKTLANDLRLLDERLRARLPDGVAHGAGETTPPPVDYPSPPRPDGVFVVAGPIDDDSLLRLIESLGAPISGLESCTSPDRWKALVSETGLTDQSDAGGTDDVGDTTTDPYEALASRLLGIGMCPRRSTVERMEHLARRLDESRPASIIYARQSFCDPGAYDALVVAELAEKRGLPFLELEVSFPCEVGGPLRTRVEAFLEARLLDDDLLDDLDDDWDDDDLFDDALLSEED